MKTKQLDKLIEKYKQPMAVNITSRERVVLDLLKLRKELTQEKEDIHCDYCDGGGETLFKANQIQAWRTDSVDVEITGKQLFIMATADNTSYTANFEINYCPMCGKKLR